MAFLVTRAHCSLKISCLTQDNSRSCGVIKSTTILSYSIPFRRFLSSPSPGTHLCGLGFRAGFAPPDLERKTAGEPSCSWRTMSNTRSIPATPHYIQDWEDAVPGCRGWSLPWRAGSTHRQLLHTLPRRREDSLDLLLLIKYALEQDHAGTLGCCRC